MQRELQRLSEAGIIKREGNSRTVTYRLDPESPVFDELRSLLVKTVGAAEHLRRALAPLQHRIDVGFIYGSYAKDTRLRPGSDIDLMVIGDASFGDVVEHTAVAQRELGHPFLLSEVRGVPREEPPALHGEANKA